MDGSGASAGLVLIRKPTSASGYYGVGKNGKKWQARVYKAAKQQWDAVGNFESPREAAIVAAIAQKQTAAGFGYLYSPLKKRSKKGALPTSQHVRLAAHCTSCSATCSSCVRGSPNPDRDPERPAVVRARLDTSTSATGLLHTARMCRLPAHSAPPSDHVRRAVDRRQGRDRDLLQRRG